MSDQFTGPPDGWGEESTKYFCLEIAKYQLSLIFSHSIARRVAPFEALRQMQTKIYPIDIANNAKEKPFDFKEHWISLTLAFSAGC